MHDGPKRCYLIYLKRVMIAVLATCILAAPVSAATQTQLTMTPEAIRSYLEGRNDAYRHVLVFGHLQFKDPGPSGMPITRLYIHRTESQKNAYILGAMFGFSHLSYVFGRSDLVSCFNSFGKSAPAVLDTLYKNDPTIGEINVMGVLMNFCVSTREVQEIARSMGAR